MKSKNSPGVRCTECGCRLDPGERCDCERITAEKRTVQRQAKTRQNTANNMRSVEQALLEWDYA